MARAVPWMRLAAFVVWLVPATTAAQVVEVPTYQVTGPLFSNFLQWGDVAVAPDGNLVFVWGEAGTKRALVSGRFTSSGLSLGGGFRIDEGGHSSGGQIVPNGQGGFLVGYQDDTFPFRPRGRLLDGEGTPIGAEFAGACEPETFHGIDALAVTALPNGAAFVYSEFVPEAGLRACLLDANGNPRGGSIRIDDTGQRPYVASRTDGGFVVGWSVGDDAYVSIHNAVGQQVVGPLLVMSGIGVSGLATNGIDGFVLVGSKADDDGSVDLWAGLFAADATPVAPPFEVYDAPSTLFAFPAVEYDFGGNVYVVWGELGPGSQIRVRGFDPTGAPFGPAIPVTPFVDPFRIAATRLPNGSFVNTWPAQHRLYANVVSLCVPGVAVCGDGVLVPQCELCDAGGGNSDTAPDACRTDCRPARCGDGVVDGPEGCDDGNTTSCDGCSASCQSEAGLACGDGVVAATCGETCDDGNADAGDGCTATCALERIPGGGSRSSDCYIEWSVANPTNVPFLDRVGAINQNQSCVDDDPRCDTDPTPGACAFRVRVCANNTDVDGCLAPNRLATWSLLGPSAKQASRDPVLAAIRASFATLPAVLVGAGGRNVCSDFIEVPVPLRAGFRAGKLKLKAEATDYDRVRDRDQLRLTCLPATP